MAISVSRRQVPSGLLSLPSDLILPPFAAQSSGWFPLRPVLVSTTSDAVWLSTPPPEEAVLPFTVAVASDTYAPSFATSPPPYPPPEFPAMTSPTLAGPPEVV